MYYPPYGMFPYAAPAQPRGLTLEDIKEARKQLKELEEDIKGGEKKDKAKKPDPIKFTFLETWSLLMLGSIPVTLGQLWLLDYVKHTLNALH